MLKELGMEGRLSMEKARRVRERRELARELEDVQTFEKAVVHGTSSARSSRQQKDKSSGGNESDVEDALDTNKKGGEGDGDGDSEEEVVGKPKRKVNARQSIMAFLGDQSDSE
ncbi:hypothetical protein BC629DRAFT_1539503 [Irpex lacteus]|nr:hypothetical protein BC629DRAFT_1539503 [Irpex lacteus]